MLETALNFYQQDNIHGLQMQEFFSDIQLMLQGYCKLIRMFQIGDKQRMIKKKKLYRVYDYDELLDKKKIDYENCYKQ